MSIIKKIIPLKIAALLLITVSASAADNDFKLNSIHAKDLRNGSAYGTLRQKAPEKGLFDWFAPKPAPVKPSAGPLAVKDWSLIIYMNGKNNVEKFALKDVDEMEKVGTTDRVNVVVELGSKGHGSKRMLIQKKQGGNSSSVVYSEDPTADMGDYKRAADFLKWGKTNFPARHYMFIIWNHGLGWIDPVMKGPGQKGISFDEDTKNYIRTIQMPEIFKIAGGVDIYASNACLMQMAEVAYEIKDYAGMILGSEETMLANGYDYTMLINLFQNNPAITNEQFTSSMTTWYKKWFEGGLPVWGPITVPLSSMGATLSGLRTSELNNLPSYLNNWTAAIMTNNETDAVKYAIQNVVRFNCFGPQDKKKELTSYGDLYHFVRLASLRAVSNDAKTTGQALLDFISGRLVIGQVGLNTDENGDNYTNTGGIAIELTRKSKNPPPQLGNIFETKYSMLALSKDSNWDEFITWTDNVWKTSN